MINMYSCYQLSLIDIITKLVVWCKIFFKIERTLRKELVKDIELPIKIY